MMKLAPPILLLTNTAAFTPIHRPLPIHGWYERPPAVQEAVVDVDTDVNSFNIGGMPTDLEGVKQRQIARVSFCF